MALNLVARAGADLSGTESAAWLLGLVSFNSSPRSSSVILIKLVLPSQAFLIINVLIKAIHMASLIFISSFSDVSARSTVQNARRVFFPALELGLGWRD
jgi:hypothetical protein